MLDAIFAHKRAEVAAQRARVPLHELTRAALAMPNPPDFLASLRRAPCRPALIAEIKRASPSRGPLAPGLDPAALARIYADSGAAAISVLTDARFFGGSLDDLRTVAALELGVPMLRKDFICEPYQVYEARAAGASAVLLIAAHLEIQSLCELHRLALSLALTPLVEVHAADELDRALMCDPRLIGINNRDLHTFRVSLDATEMLSPRVPAHVVVVSESGIFTAEHVARLAELRRSGGTPGVDAILVGEALVTAPDTAALTRLLSAAGHPNPIRTEAG
jgi:indole-3-glycerol phosphate synthase